MKNFMGKDGFTWFVGVVEDRNDPKKLGRLRVRCLGYHTKELNKLPTADLPWAHVMNPITSATVSGVGNTPLGSVEGTWVVGFFIDGLEAQNPMIMGTLPGVPKDLPVKDALEGFQDYINANYPKYKESDVNRLARNDDDAPHSTLSLRKADRDLAVGIAQIDGIFSGVAPIDPDLDATFWDEPETEYAAKYPNNHVFETEGGHIKEFDDTVDKQRIHERHSSGSGYEIFNDGTKVTRVKQDNYSIISNDEYCHIQGNSRETFDKGVRIRVNASGESGNNYNVEVGQGSNVNIEVNGGNINLTTLASGQDAGDININCSRDLNVQVGRNLTMDVIETITETSKKKTQSTQNTHQQNAALHDINGNRIDLN
tara:strand:- start:269 stop:1378 length:1110 start_codon:yes stop_codon:yes gene_type:complete